ncbi:class I SAM-dependent methyltransferase [Acidicapsa ligni]|uniref:class I SAM-dependent methyltransferase n=1 Tax=Acidicapsa ligni TaxID=542300 RepID=UPI0021E0627F|nr:class I SAM-dependent methyltransferase [Acidicapsa ligni]
MKTNDAREFLRTPLIEWEQPQSWCDLGSGTGTFTLALASLLVPGSTIHAVDWDPQALEQIPEQHNGVNIRKIAGDMASSSLRLPPVDGVLLANSLHFIREQPQFLTKLLTVTNCFLIVEYERSKPNRWGPYPVAFGKLRQLCSDAGIGQVEKIATRPSLFGGTLYSAVAQKPKALDSD